MKEQLIARIQKTMDADAKHSLLSAWERGFLESIKEQVDRRGSLSPKQLEIFAKSEAKCTSDAVEESKSWAKLYQTQYKDIAIACARYYKSAGYFTNLATEVLENPEFIPSRQAYKKMCENKYAQKVLATLNATPLYGIGSTILMRSPAISYSNRRLDGVPCLVLEILSEVLTSAKGGKRYKVLPYGEGMPLVLEERQIKKCKPGTKKKSKKKSFDDIPF
mgnify:CR=1 FL=1